MKFLLLGGCLLFLACGQERTSPREEPGTIVTKAKVGTTKGNEVGNGADYISDDVGSAWFLGKDKIIRYCIIPTRDFGYTTDQLKTIIEDSFQEWSKYIEAKQINASRDSRLSISTQVLYEAQCARDTELKFYFGVSDSASEYYRNHFEKPLGFVARTNGEPAQGLVWIAPPLSLSEFQNNQRRVPDWTQSYSLKGVVIHEIGHVLGCAHVDGTIMEADIATFIISDDENLRLNHLTEIDGYKELVICETCVTEFSGHLGLGISNVITKKGEVIHDDEQEVFNVLEGRGPQGKISARVTMDLSGYVLHVSDDLTKVGGDSFPLMENASQLKLGYRRDDVFKVQKILTGDDGKISDVVQHFYDEGFFKRATLFGFGSSLSIDLVRNMDDGTYLSPLTIQYTLGTQTKVLFRADYIKGNN